MLPLAKTIFDRRHLPFSLTKRFLHFDLLAANTPNFPFWKVSSQLNVPGSPTDTVNVITPVVGFTVMSPVLTLLLGAVVDVMPDVSSDGSRDIGGEVMTGSLATANDCWTCGAGSYSSSPVWPASTVHVPASMKSTVAPETEHTEGVPEEKDTGSPEEADAAAV